MAAHSAGQASVKRFVKSFSGKLRDVFLNERGGTVCLNRFMALRDLFKQQLSADFAEWHKTQFIADRGLEADYLL